MPKHLLLAVLLSQALFVGAAESDDILDRARAMISEGEKLREAAETRFRQTEIACYDKFLVNYCLDRARKARNEEISKARELEIGGKRMELAERRRVAEQRQTSIDMRSGRDVPEPMAVPGLQDSPAPAEREAATPPASAPSPAQRPKPVAPQSRSDGPPVVDLQPQPVTSGQNATAPTPARSRAEVIPLSGMSDGTQESGPLTPLGAPAPQ